MIRRLLEARQLQDAVAHLRESEARDPKHVALERHHIRQQLHVPRINVHLFPHHGVELRDDARARRFDPEHPVHFVDVVRLGLGAHDAGRRHACFEPVALDQQHVLLAAVGVARARLGDDGTRRVGVAFDRDARQPALQVLHADEVLLLLVAGGHLGAAAALALVLGAHSDAQVGLLDAHVVGVDFEGAGAH